MKLLISMILIGSMFSYSAMSKEWEVVGTIDDIPKWEDTTPIKTESKEEVLARWKREIIALENATKYLQEVEEYLGRIRKAKRKDKLIDRLGK